MRVRGADPLLGLQTHASDLTVEDQPEHGVAGHELDGSHREIGQSLTFGYGAHYCLGAALARIEGRVALDEVLNRWPEWDIDLAAARRAPTSTVRGWDSMPAVIR